MRDMEFGRLPPAADLAAVDFALPPDDPRSTGRGAPSAPTRFHLGAPAFAVRPWVGPVYPAGTRPDALLAAYAALFDGLELNSTYYAVPAVAQVEKWVAMTPPGFRFCPKVPRDAIDGDAGALAAFNRVLPAFGDRLGLCLLQLTPAFSPARFESLRKLTAAIAAPGRVAVELRHPDFFVEQTLAPRVYDWMAEAGVHPVVTDTAARREVLHTSRPTEKLLLRFQCHNGHPTDFARAAAWAERLAAWGRDGLAEAHVFVHQPGDLDAPPVLAALAEGLNRCAGAGLRVFAPPPAPLPRQPSLFPTQG
jgi:uncharacterized protein YecE (DUF72 family)